MDVFLAKITNRENVDLILKKEEFTHIDIYNFESEMNIGSLVFLVFSGDKARIDWEQGVIGFGHISKAPYNKGYHSTKERYFKIDIQPDFVLEQPLSPKFTKLHPKYQNELYDVPYVGANHFPNQAIAKTSGKSAEALFRLFGDIEPSTTSDFDFDFLKKKDSATIKDEFRDFLSEKNKSSTVSSYVNALERMPEYLNGININCPFVWDEGVNKDQLKVAANLVKSESVKENGGRMGAYIPKSHWNNGWFFSGVNNFIAFLEKSSSEQKVIQKNIPNSTQRISQLPKPFLLLAGISGTGKTRFVRAQAARSNGWSADDPRKPDNYELVAVRPDWHEPSDLLGYVSRINGFNYVPTVFLKFLVKAWQEVFNNSGSLTSVGHDSRPFWLCLDEMNLAPVEQYFADYLSILESRKWTDSGYSSLPIISDDLELVKGALGGDAEEELWSAFISNGGIPIPPNLIVAGTVNMDETTHGFSRKVIDRALTLDFQEFFPNRYNDFFTPLIEPKLFSFSVTSQVSSPEDLSEVSIDSNGEKSIAFLSKINNKLKSTPFELAFRALNELLLSVKCFKPQDNKSLVAVWDDFLMQKVLPRIEGDADKLRFTGDDESGLLNELSNLLKAEFKIFLGSDNDIFIRPDILNQKTNGGEAESCKCKSINKIKWMQERLVQNQYTSFWA